MWFAIIMSPYGLRTNKVLGLSAVKCYQHNTSETIRDVDPVCIVFAQSLSKLCIIEYAVF